MVGSNCKKQLKKEEEDACSPNIFSMKIAIQLKHIFGRVAFCLFLIYSIDNLVPTIGMGWVQYY